MDGYAHLFRAGVILLSSVICPCWNQCWCRARAARINCSITVCQSELGRITNPAPALAGYTYTTPLQEKHDKSRSNKRKNLRIGLVKFYTFSWCFFFSRFYPIQISLDVFTIQDFVPPPFHFSRNLILHRPRPSRDFDKSFNVKKKTARQVLLSPSLFQLRPRPLPSS